MSNPLLPFELEHPNEADASLASLTAGQRAQLDAALSYHALLNPGARIEARVSTGTPNQMPALTDRTTVSGEAAATAVATVTVRSVAVGEPAVESAASAESAAPANDATVVRHIRLGHADATPATTEPPASFSIPRKVYRALEKRTPVLLDTAREFIMTRRERKIAGELPRYPNDEGGRTAAPAFAAWHRVPKAPPVNAPPAILFGLHWLQTGGAERWAVESIRLAKQAGFLPVVVTDQNSVHPWVTRPELEGCVVITMSFNDHLHQIDVALAHALLENYNFHGVVAHHCQWLYLCLPFIKRHRPELPVVDSLHIVEYLGGGYPGISAQYDEFVDTHHVISPQLVDWLSRVQGVREDRIVMAPLTQLTVDESRGFTPRDPSKPLTIAFIGRLSRQKRPDLFLALVHRLRKRGVKFHAILQGDGEMREVVHGLIDSFKLRGIIEQRFEDVPVADTLAETDVLVLTSINEGLTLTTFEAVAAGVPVLSTNVGSQYTLVEGDMLAPRPARRFLRSASKQIAELAKNEALREATWRQQSERVQQFNEHENAHLYFERLFAQWQA